MQVLACRSAGVRLRAIAAHVVDPRPAFRSAPAGAIEAGDLLPPPPSTTNQCGESVGRTSCVELIPP